jgi:hypothetical protein
MNDDDEEGGINVRARHYLIALSRAHRSRGADGATAP